MSLRPVHNDFIDIHTHHSEASGSVFSIRNVFLSDYPEVPEKNAFSIGLHPWHLSSESETSVMNLLKKAALHPCLVAIGETGLDKVIKTSPEIQENFFRLHVKVSEEFKKPIIIHCVKAFNELILLKRNLSPSSPWIIHGYHGSEQLTGSLIKEGFYISVNEWILKNPEAGKKMLNMIPFNRLFLETDEYTSHISNIYRFTAEWYKMNLKSFKETILKNFNAVF